MPAFDSIGIEEIITITFTLFAVIDILGSIPILISLKDKMGGSIRSTQATVASGAFMILFLFLGKPFLNLLGLDVQSFAVAGSIVIFILGLEMILGLEFFKPDSNPRSGSVVHIGLPLIARWGILTTIMSLKWIEQALGPSGLIVVRKFFGVILIAIAVKIIGSNIAAIGR